MTTATDAQVRLRAPIADEAMAAINAARVRRVAVDSIARPPLALSDFRDEAYRQILVALRNRDVTPDMITRPDDLRESEVCLTVALLCEATSQRGASAQQQTTDLFGQEAVRWRLAYDAAISAAAPTLGLRGGGRSFTWSRG